MMKKREKLIENLKRLSQKGVTIDELIDLLENVDAINEIGLVSNITGDEESNYCINKANEINKEIEKQLSLLNLSVGSNGYKYSKMAIYMVIDNPVFASNFVGALYPELAKKFGISITSLRYTIRQTINTAYNEGKGSSNFQKIFGTQNPKMKEFIVTIANIVTNVLNL